MPEFYIAVPNNKGVFPAFKGPQGRIRCSGQTNSVPSPLDVKEGGVCYNFADDKFFVRRGNSIHAYRLDSVTIYDSESKPRASKLPVGE